MIIVLIDGAWNDDFNSGRMEWSEGAVGEWAVVIDVIALGDDFITTLLSKFGVKKPIWSSTCGF